jgi:RNA polymerase sigma-70 factor (ECF subfamily)
VLRPFVLPARGTDPVIAAEARRAHLELEQKLRPFVARRVPPSDLDDVLQDVFLRIERALPALRDEERFVPWLYAVARSAIFESHRQRSRHIAVDIAATVEPEAPYDGSEPTALEQELAGYLLGYVAQLPSPYREALTLTEIEGMTQKAAAAALGISLSGMKSRVQRGRERLRELFEACCRLGVDARGRVVDCEPRDPSGCRCQNS